MEHKAVKLYHSGVRISGEKVIYIDPWKIEGEPRDADLILVTHEHFDHYSPEDIQRLSKEGTCLVVPRNMEKLGIPGAEYVQPGEKNIFCGVPVETVAAYNIGRPFHTKETENVGYIVEQEGIRYFVAGDTDFTPENKEVKCDVAFVPAGGKYTMDASEAAKLVNAIRPKVAIPIHYGTVTESADAAEVFRKAVSAGIAVEIHNG